MSTSELDVIAGKPAETRMASVVDYITRAESKLSDARKLRDRTIDELRRQGLPRRQVAEMAGVSLAHVAQVFRAFDLAGAER